MTHGNPQSSRTLNKILENAETSGHLQLVSRRLKEIRDLVFKHDFSNLTLVDLSHNRLGEIPPELLDWQCLNTLILSNNVLKSIPEYILQLHLLEMINLSSNQLTVLPTQLCCLKFLKIIKLSSNRIISLPEEIGLLKNCQELDVSDNELTSIPREIGDMTSLLSLNIRRNNVHALPEELAKMRLTHLDAACNLIATIPVSFQNMTSLQCLLLDNNPLTSPRLTVLRKGRVHLFRELGIQAERAQIKKEVLDDPVMSPMKRSNSVRTDFLKMTSMSTEETQRGKAEERLEKAAEMLKDRRKASVSSAANQGTEKSPKKKSPKERERDIAKRQVSSDTIPVRKPKTPPKNFIAKERKRSSSSGNFERKNSSETLLIHQKLSGFPGYKPNVPDKPNTLKECKNTDGKPQKAENSRQPGKVPAPTKKGYMPTAIKPRASLSRSRGSSFNNAGDKEGPFTMRRKTEKLYEELELLESLRHSIESRLKTQLGDEIPAALSDGVVLCHLANHVKVRSIPTVHIPSPAVPKLSLTKRRRNIDCFLDACAKIGVPSAHICSAQDILLEKNISKVATTVNELLRHSPHPHHSPKRQAEPPTVSVTASILSKQHSVV